MLGVTARTLLTPKHTGLERWTPPPQSPLVSLDTRAPTKLPANPSVRRQTRESSDETLRISFLSREQEDEV